MAHYGLENNIASVLKMDLPSKKNVPDPRWMRKKMALETSLPSTNNSMNVSVNQSLSKTPSKTPSRRTKSKSPARTKVPTTPGDRFIPNRGGTKFEMAHYKLTQPDNPEEIDSPSKLEYKKIMNGNLNRPDLNNVRIMAFQGKAPQAAEGGTNNFRVMYSQSKTPGSMKKSTRYIPQAAERVLDAPEIRDDYYLNLLDWSSTNFMAVALAGQVYLWNAASGEIKLLCELDGDDDYVSSVSWIKEGNTLAVGLSTGDVQLWDVENPKRLRTMRGHTTRVGSLSWNSHILSSGSRDGQIHHHDVRVAQHQVGSFVGHTQEVCGLQWSPDGKYLASGGNDNILNIWGNGIGQTIGETETVHTFNSHQAAVKAVSWCPWQPNILASGGGTSDRNIKIWNCNSGTCLNSVDAKSQVCSILWSKEYRELISGHGFANNQLIIWKYPTMDKIAELTGHHARILHMAMSPDGSTVVSAAADETLRLWKCFTVDPAKKKQISLKKNKENTILSVGKGLR